MRACSFLTASFVLPSESVSARAHISLEMPCSLNLRWARPFVPYAQTCVRLYRILLEALVETALTSTGTHIPMRQKRCPGPDIVTCHEMHAVGIRQCKCMHAAPEVDLWPNPARQRWVALSAATNAVRGQSFIQSVYPPGVQSVHARVILDHHPRPIGGE